MIDRTGFRIGPDTARSQERDARLDEAPTGAIWHIVTGWLTGQAPWSKPGVWQAVAMTRTTARSYILQGTQYPAPTLAGRPLSGRDPDRQSRRHHLARARDARRRRPDRLRGHPRQPQAARPLRHRDAAHALSRAQRRGGAAEAAGADRGRRRRSRSSPMPARRSFPTPATSSCARRARPAMRSPRCPARRRCWRRWSRPDCRPTASCSRASCRRRRRSGATRHCGIVAHSRDARAVRKRVAACRRRLADLAAGFGDREAAICRELTKLHEEVRRGAACRSSPRIMRRVPRPRGEFVIVIAPPG